MSVTYGIKLESKLFLCNIEVSFRIGKPNSFELKKIIKILFKNKKSYFLEHINSFNYNEQINEKQALAIIVDDLLNLYFKSDEQVTKARTKISYFRYNAFIVSKKASDLKKESKSYLFMLKKWENIIKSNNIINIAYESSIKKPPAI